MRDLKQLDNAFTYHPATEEQQHKYKRVRATAKELARAILEECPECADRTHAVRQVREAVMTANASIALQGAI